MMNKKQILSVCLGALCVCAALSVSSCEKKVVATGNVAPVPGENAAVLPPPPRLVPGVVMASTWSFRENAEGQMRATEPISSGETVDFYSITAADTGKTLPEMRKAKIVNYQGASDGKDYDFWRYAARDGDAYLLKWAAADDAIPAVVFAENVLLYTKRALDGVDTRGRKIPQYTIVAIHPDGEEDGFLCVSASIPNQPVDRMFIKGETVTQSPYDVQVMQLYQKALATENETVKMELLSNAENLGGTFSELVFDVLRQLRNPEGDRDEREEDEDDGSVG